MISPGGGEMTGRVQETAANRPSRAILEQCGWRFDGEVWRGTAAPEPPAHIVVRGGELVTA